jgi:hypothetical protein
MKSRLRTRRQRRRELQERRSALGPLKIDLTQEEILEDLFSPHPPPGRWQIPPKLQVVEDAARQDLRPAA